MKFKWEDYPEISDIVENGNEREIRLKVSKLAKDQGLSSEDLVNLQDDSGNTLLHLAVAKGVESSVKAILSLGGNSEIYNKKKQTALGLAYTKGEEFFESVKYQIDDSKLNNDIRGKSLKTIKHIEKGTNSAADLFKRNRRLIMQEAEGGKPSKSPDVTPTIGNSSNRTR